MNRQRAVVALALSAALVALIAWRAGWIGSKPLRLGAILPLSGPDQAIGAGMRNSIRLAVEQVNRQGGIQGRRVEVIEIDDASSAETSVAAARRLVGDPSVIATLAPFDDTCSLVTQTELGEGKLPTVLVTVPTRDKSQFLNPFEYRMTPLGTELMKHAARHAWNTLGIRDFAYVHDTSGLGIQVVNHMRFALSPLAGRIVTGESILRPDGDLAALVKEVLASSPKYVLFGGEVKNAARLITALRGAGYRGLFHAGTHYPSQEFIDLAKQDADGALAIFAGVPAEDTPEGREYLKRYSDHGFPDPPSIYGIHAYAGTQAILSALDKSFLSRPSVNGALSRQQLDTALGPVRFTFFSSTYQTSAIYQVAGGRWKPILVTDKSGQLASYSPR